MAKACGVQSCHAMYQHEIHIRNLQYFRNGKNLKLQLHDPIYRLRFY